VFNKLIPIDLTPIKEERRKNHKPLGILVEPKFPDIRGFQSSTRKANAGNARNSGRKKLANENPQFLL